MPSVDDVVVLPQLVNVVAPDLHTYPWEGGYVDDVAAELMS